MLRAGFLVGFIDFLVGFFKTGDFLVGSNYINIEDNYERLFDFLS